MLDFYDLHDLLYGRSFFTFRPTAFDLRDPAQVSWVGIGNSSTHLPLVKFTDLICRIFFRPRLHDIYALL